MSFRTVRTNAVDPAGLFDIRRQRRLLDGLVNRVHGSLSKRQMLEAAHVQQRNVEEAQFSTARAKVANQCRIERRKMLDRWDAAEEQLTRQYEADVAAIGQDVQRLGESLAHRARDERQQFERKMNARLQSVQQQYENRKNQPGQQHRQQIASLEASMEPLRQAVAEARALTLRRLDHIPDIGPAESAIDGKEFEEPKTIDESLHLVRELTDQGLQRVAEMHATAASRIVDSYLLPLGMVGMMLLWGIFAFLITSGSVLWIMVGIIPTAVVGFASYLALMLPLKRTTRSLYPSIERIGRSAEQAVEVGKKISADATAEASAELNQRRDEHIAEANRWMREQLLLMEQRLETEQQQEHARLTAKRELHDQSYIASFTELDARMRAEADALAARITQQLATVDNNLQQQRDANAVQRFQQLQHLTSRLNHGVRSGMERMERVSSAVTDRFPAWPDVVANLSTANGKIDFLPLGWLQIDQELRRALQLGDTEIGATDDRSPSESMFPALVTASQQPMRLPLVLHRRLFSTVVIRCPAQQREQATLVVHQLLWRFLTAAPPGLARLTLLDALTAGQSFAEFLALADHDPEIIGHRVWIMEPDIEARLAELAQHIEDCNQVVGALAEPYRAIAGIGFPESLSRTAYGHLCALIEAGQQCGIFTALVCDRDTPWPAGMAIPSGQSVLQVEIDQAGSWHCLSAGLEKIPLIPADPPPPDLCDDLVRQIGTFAVVAAKLPEV
jgi:S-DNA-T family DNA segregation ATPase FtsK/SpoIIIE